MIELKFSEVEWGKDDSKHDSGLLNYFVTIPEYDGLISGQYRYIIGRKGTGKTAICRHIKLTAENEPTWFQRYVTLRSFPIAELRKLEDRSMAEKSKYVPVWKFLLLREIAEMVAEDNGIQDKIAQKEIHAFLERNFPGVTTFTDTLTILQKSDKKVSISNKWLGGIDQSNISSSEFSTTVQYQRVTDILIERMKALVSNGIYFIIIDELDEGWRAGDSRLRLILLALLRAVESLAQDFEEGSLKVRPILALRSDIFDSLEDADLNKYDDFIVRLRWSARESVGHSLKAIVNARIVHAFHLPASGNYWNAIAYENDPTINSTPPSLWKWITNRTLERPRDVIKFLKICKKLSPAGRLDFKEAHSAEKAYSEWFYNELRDELQSHIEVWREMFDAISRVGLTKIEKPTDLIAEFNNDDKIVQWLSEHKKKSTFLLHECYEFGIIGNIKANGYWQFKYKNEHSMFDDTAPLVVHYGLVRKLSLKNNWVDI